METWFQKKSVTPRTNCLGHVIIHWLMAKRVDLRLLHISNSPHVEVIKQSPSTAADNTPCRNKPANGRETTAGDEIRQSHQPAILGTTLIMPKIDCQM